MLAGWLAGWLASWLAGWLAGWLINFHYLTTFTILAQIIILGSADKISIKDLLDVTLGYKYSFIGPVVGILVGFIVFFAGLAIGEWRRAYPLPPLTTACTHQSWFMNQLSHLA